MVQPQEINGGISIHHIDITNVYQYAKNYINILNTKNNIKQLNEKCRKLKERYKNFIKLVKNEHNSPKKLAKTWYISLALGSLVVYHKNKSFNSILYRLS